MTESEKTKVLAEFVFGEEKPNPWKIVKGCIEFDTDKYRWKPFQNENHGRMVIVKLMEDLDLFARYCDEILDEDTDQRGAMQCAFQATLTERMDAVVSILPEKK